MFSCSNIFSELSIHFLGMYIMVPRTESKCMIYWHAAFILNCRPMKIYWWTNRMQKLHQNIFFNWKFFNNTIRPFFFIQATDITLSIRTSSMEISLSFLWNGNWVFGSPDKIENDKLHSNAIIKQNEQEPDVVLDSRKNMMINLAF